MCIMHFICNQKLLSPFAYFLLFIYSLIHSLMSFKGFPSLTQQHATFSSKQLVTSMLTLVAQPRQWHGKCFIFVILMHVCMHIIKQRKNVLYFGAIVNIICRHCMDYTCEVYICIYTFFFISLTLSLPALFQSFLLP